jgi:hypothetical protein
MHTWETVPDGTFFETPEGLVPVTPTDGYFVGLRTNTRAGIKAPFIGIWTASDGERFVDPSRWVQSFEKAIRLGTTHEQIAIWDCKNNREVFL